MSNGRTPIGAFIHSSWGNMNIRAGKYRHHKTIDKCKTYENVNIAFTQQEYKNFCIAQKDLILSLKRPSVDRLNKNDDYTLDNIQFIELADNIRKDRTVFKDGFGTCYKCKHVKKEEEFRSDKRRINGKSNICKICHNEENKTYKEKLKKKKKQIYKLLSMKTVQDLKVGDKIYFYFPESHSIDTREVSDVKLLGDGCYKISIKGIGELIPKYLPTETSLGFYYLEFKEVKERLVVDVKESIKELRMVRDRVARSTNKEIKTLKGLIESYKNK